MLNDKFAAPIKNGIMKESDYIKRLYIDEKDNV